MAPTIEFAYQIFYIPSGTMIAHSKKEFPCSLGEMEKTHER